MKIFEIWDATIKGFAWYHISLIKFSTFVFALFLAKYYPALLSAEWYVYVILFSIPAIPVFQVMFKAGRSVCQQKE